MRWWPSSSLVIELRTSRFYKRLLLSLVILLLWGVWLIEETISWRSGVWCGLIGVFIGRVNVFALPLVRLQYSGGRWFCELTHQTLTPVKAVRLLLEVGGWLVLHLEIAGKWQTHVIFKDQCSDEQWRRLRWLLASA